MAAAVFSKDFGRTFVIQALAVTRRHPLIFMKEFKIKHLTVFKGDASPEKKYRPELSKLLMENLGDGPYSDHDTARKAITFSFNYFCDKFLELCHSENSVRFYQLVFSQHEQAIEIAFFAKKEHYPKGITEEYIAIYRRILKWILEQACDINLHNQETHDQSFIDRAKRKLNELVFLGDMIFSNANLYAEQDIIEDVVEVKFDKQDLYVFSHKHHYDFIIQKIQKSNGIHSIKHVVDELAIEDLKVAIEKCFRIKYEYLTTVIAEIHKINESKGGQYCGFGWESLPLSVESMFGGNPTQARILFKGLTLDKSNKLKLNDLACRPQTMFRYLYRPISIWNIEGEDFAVVGKNGFTESIIQLATNAIPWGKAPDEWIAIKCFKEYVHSKEDEHDKWLDDEVENKLKENALPFHRNITNINSEKGKLSLLVKDVGEIDFVIINHETKKIYIADCKHLQGRYDMMTQKNDFSNFTKEKGSYNTQITNKIKWAKENLLNLDFHNKSMYGKDSSSIVDYAIEGIFIINTPTFYMYNSDFRIYTVDVFAEIITGKLKDPELMVFVDNDESMTTFNISYPYFKKPDYKLIDSLETEE